MRTILALCTLTSLAHAQGALPPLAESRELSLSQPIDERTPITQDNHYAALIAHVQTWGNLMPLWNATPRQRPEPRPASDFAAVGSSVFARPGEPFVFSARFIRKAPLEGRPNVERWVVNPYDANTNDRGPTPVVVYVDRRISGRIQEPRSGWHINFATRAYRPTLVESVRGNTLPTQSFIGAVYYVGPTPQGDLSARFAWIGIAISVVIAIGIVLGITMAVHLRRKKTGQASP